VAGLCLAGAFVVQFGVPDVIGFIGGTSYVRDVEARLEQEDARGALAALDSATLFDRDALERLERTGAQGSLAGPLRRDARLRIWIAQLAVSELGTLRSLTEEQGEWLDAAIGNAELAVDLDPASAKAQLVLGLLNLKRGEVANARIDFLLAVRHLGDALARDPELSSARAALRVAQRRARAD